MNIRFEKTTTPKQKPTDQNALGFGQIFTDHMFVMNFEEGKGWFDPRIIPYQNISLDPAAMVFHYAQAVFEGLKAYRGKDGEIMLFRPDMNFERINISNERLCIPPIDVESSMEALKQLLKIEYDWIPSAEGTSLYVRPFIIATDPYVGVRPSKTYLFIIILSPVGNYYPEGINPVKIYIETEYVRASKGGIGFAKAAANYAISLKSQMKAKDLGFTQVLWLDGVHRKYIEEVGTMNVFFKIDGKIITPELQGSILPGVTRNSSIEMLKDMGFEVIERAITIDEVFEAYQDGKLEEAFGTGTAAVVSPIGSLVWEDKSMQLSDGKIGPVSARLYDEITGIQYGKNEDKFGWMVRV